MIIYSRMEEKRFTKYIDRGNCHWEEEFNGGIGSFNLVQHGRFMAVLEQLPSAIGTVLDWGCGDGALSKYLLDRCQAFIGVDTEQEGLNFFEKNLSSYRSRYSLYKIGYDRPYDLPQIADGSCDVVICSDVIEHVQEPERLVREFYRVLKPGGIAVITTPYRLTEAPNDPMHVKEYYPQELRALVEGVFGASSAQSALYQKVLYYSLYTYHWRSWAIFRYLMNFFFRLTGYNPLMQTDKNKQKWDIFNLIVLKATKPSVV
mgnify:CR=1 FL=1